MRISHLLLLTILALLGCSNPASTVNTELEPETTIPLSVPTNLQHVIEDSLIKLTWDDSTTLYSYSIYMVTSRGEHTSDSLLRNVRSPFTLTLCDSTTTYSFRIKAQNVQGESEFSEELTFTYYATIINTEPRILSIIAEKPEIVPGDTITLRSYWTDNPVTVSDIEWSVSWKLKKDPFGMFIAEDSVSLEPYMVSILEIATQAFDTTVFEMKVVIPEDIVIESPDTPELLENAFLSRGLLPPEEYGIPDSCKHAVTFIDSIASLNSTAKEMISEEEGLVLNVLCQILTVDFKLYVKTATQINGNQITFPVRYNSLLVPIPGIDIEQ